MIKRVLIRPEAGRVTLSRGKNTGASKEETHYHYLHFTDEEMGDLSTQSHIAERAMGT